jgi:Fe-S-cluster containining protein
MEKFKCSQCGKCCTTLEDPKINEKKFPGFVSSVVYNLQKPKLVVEDFEIEEFRKNCDKRYAESIKPWAVVFDLKNKISIVLSWSFDFPSCPFFQENKCVMYEHRPNVCRYFPVTINILKLIKEGKIEPVDSICPSELKPRELEKELKKLKTKGKAASWFLERYPKEFWEKLKYDVWISSLKIVLTNLARAQIIIPVRKGIDEKKLQKMIKESKKIGVVEFAKSVGYSVPSEKELEKLCREIGEKTFLRE